mmetsp:Transcript_29389/g.80735  ORF Transcript_29389/g.80735 Transcript_29389/m.80735 type:complete len:267 (+) Transcript_29389:836-1636(+)
MILYRPCRRGVDCVERNHIFHVRLARLFGNGRESLIGLIATSSNGARQGVESSSIEGRFIVQVERRSSLDPMFVLKIRRNRCSVGPNIEFDFGLIRIVLTHDGVDGWDRVVDARKEPFVSIIHHVRPRIQVGNGSQQRSRFRRVLHFGQVRHGDTSVLEIAQHVSPKRPKDGQQEISLGHGNHGRWLHGFLNGFSQAMHDGIAQFHPQTHFAVHQGAQGNFRKSRGRQGGELTSRNHLRRHSRSVETRAVFLVRGGGGQTKEFINR